MNCSPWCLIFLVGMIETLKIIRVKVTFFCEICLMLKITALTMTYFMEDVLLNLLS